MAAKPANWKDHFGSHQRVDPFRGLIGEPENQVAAVGTVASSASDAGAEALAVGVAAVAAAGSAKVEDETDAAGWALVVPVAEVATFASTSADERMTAAAIAEAVVTGDAAPDPNASSCAIVPEKHTLNYIHGRESHGFQHRHLHQCLAQ